ncbi:cytochrome c oxidase assembly protein [Sphaerisporangium rhizosphaerae]
MRVSPHDMHGHGAGAHGGVVALLPVMVAVLAAGCYALAAARRRREARGWSHRRTAAFLAGTVLQAVAFLPPVATLAAHDLRGHMIQHLLAGMLAPLGLVLGAPVTLVLRSAGPRGRRAVAAVLRSRYLHAVAGPWTAAAINLGGLATLYATPLYRAASGSPALHVLVHAHVVAAGCLFAWVIAGPDPAPRRPPVPRRLVVLGVAIAAHAALSQLMYAGLLPGLDAPAAERQGAAEIMYYGGDIAELLLALAMLTTWRPSRRSRAAPAYAPAAH